MNPLKTTRLWAVRVGQAWVRRPHMRLARTTADAEISWGAKAPPGSRHGRGETSPALSGNARNDPHSRRAPTSAAVAAKFQEANEGDAALSRELTPMYLVFILDAVGLGVALPVLPFFVMGLKATALQLAIVVSSNYIAQTFGKIFDG
ncbi:unnamed protein product [Sphacelaria rigidula]